MEHTEKTISVPPFPAPALTQVAVAHHIFGTLAQPSPHVSHEIIQLPHRQGDVVFVNAAIVSESLCDPLPEAPQHLMKKDRRNPNQPSSSRVRCFVARSEENFDSLNVTSTFPSVSYASWETVIMLSWQHCMVKWYTDPLSLTVPQLEKNKCHSHRHSLQSCLSPTDRHNLLTWCF